MRRKQKTGFTLTELVIVVLIVGVLAAVAAPRVYQSSQRATDNGLRQTLSVVRDAIQQFASHNDGNFPGAGNIEAKFKSDLAPYLRGPFPKCPVGAMNDQVKITNSPSGISGIAAPAKGWAFNRKDGKFIVNYSGLSGDGVTPYDDF